MLHRNGALVLGEIRKLTLTALALITLLLPLQVSAISDPDKKAVLLDTPYYSQNLCADTGDSAIKTTNDAVKLRGKSTEEMVYNFFIDKGFNPIQAAGITGNLKYESQGLKTDAANGDAYGLAQWLGTRKDNLTKYAQDHSASITNLDIQLGFLWNEITDGTEKATGVIDAVKKAKTIEDAVYRWDDLFERSGHAGLSDRNNAARETYRKFKNASTASSTSGSPSNNAIDVKKIVDKYNLHSVSIQQLGGGQLDSYHADTPPTAPGSTMKLIIADTLLRNNIPLDQMVSIDSELYYGGENDLHKPSVTISEALSLTLSQSKNTGANVLIKALGGVSGATSKIHAAGYGSTTVKYYYDSNNPGKNISTIGDQVDAMNHLYTTTGSGYTIAQSALRDAAKNNNHYGVDDEANKWAGTTDVAGNVGVFNINGKKYIIGLYYDGNFANPAAEKAIKDGSVDLVDMIKGANVDNSNTISPNTCCQDVTGDGSGGNAVNDGSIWNSGLTAPFIMEQWAIEVLKDIAKKKGVPESDAVTREHVVALVAFAHGEGGDIANGSTFNPLNLGGYAELVSGDSHGNGTQAFKSFDAGVEAVARQFTASNDKRLGNILTKPNSTARQFVDVLFHYERYPGEKAWAEAGDPKSPYYRSDYVDYEHSQIKQVRADYKGTAGLEMGTSAHEQTENKTHPEKLQFDGGGADATDDSGSCAAAAAGDTASIVASALKFSWPDDSHGRTPKPEYEDAINKYNHGVTPDDCGHFVATVMRASGADSGYPAGGTAIQEKYVRDSNKYDVIDRVESTADLKPGDILIVNNGSNPQDGHTLIYVGKQGRSGFDAASASYQSRAGNLGPAILSDSRGNYLRARLK